MNLIAAIDLAAVVGVVLYLLAVLIVFALLAFLIHYVGGKFPSDTTTLIVKIADVALVVLVVIIIIYVVLALLAGERPFVWSGGEVGRPVH